MSRKLDGGRRSWLDVAASVSMIAASVVFVCAVVLTALRSSGDRQGTGPPEEEFGRRGVRVLPTAPIPFDDAPGLGSATAKIGVIEFSDFECPYCRRFAVEILGEIKRRYVDAGLVRFGLRHLPLGAIHPSAQIAAEAAECAHRQGSFWKMHDALVVAPVPLQQANLVSAASRAGLDTQRFLACLRDGEAAPRVREDAEAAKALRITGTPTFLFGVLDGTGSMRVVRRESGALDAVTFGGILDELLAGQGANTSPK